MSFTMFAGDTKRLNFTLTNGDASGTPLDISDAVVVWQASKGTVARFSAIPVLTKTVANGGLTIVDELNGQILVELLPADTQALNGNFYHELQLQDASGDVATAFAGEFVVKRALIP